MEIIKIFSKEIYDDARKRSWNFCLKPTYVLVLRKTFSTTSTQRLSVDSRDASLKLLLNFPRFPQLSSLSHVSSVHMQNISRRSKNQAGCLYYFCVHDTIVHISHWLTYFLTSNLPWLDFSSINSTFYQYTLYITKTLTYSYRHFDFWKKDPAGPRRNTTFYSSWKP